MNRLKLDKQAEYSKLVRAYYKRDGYRKLNLKQYYLYEFRAYMKVWGNSSRFKRFWAYGRYFLFPVTLPLLLVFILLILMAAGLLYVWLFILIIWDKISYKGIAFAAFLLLVAAFCYLAVSGHA